MYSYNIFYYKDAITYLFDRKEQRLGYALKNWSDVKQSKLQTDLYGSESTWINNNCDCPPTTEEEDIYATNPNSSATVTETPGHFYYDGSAPQQLLVPTPTSPPLNEKIEWVDYSSNSNNNYYNASSTTDPAILLATRLANANTFVNDKTVTTNL